MGNITQYEDRKKNVELMNSAVEILVNTNINIIANNIAVRRVV